MALFLYVFGRFFRFQSALLGVAGCALLTGIAAGEEIQGLELFEKKIRPVLAERCYECHSANAKKIRGGLLLDSRAGLRKGGDSGVVIVPGKPEESLLIKAIRYHDEDLQMPPKNRLSEDEIGTFVQWVKLGAADPRDGKAIPSQTQLAEARKFWSFQPVRRPALPVVKDKQWPQTPIDHFILSALEKRQLKPMSVADRRTLIRRATYDVIGLPPAPHEIDEFVNDPAPLQQAFAKVVDRLLSSSHYGERWGRHWMDVVRYADTAGDNSDYPVPELYRYRNYIIESFNADKPYDQFAREQIAGDLLPARNQAQKNEHIIATGYIALSRRFGSIIQGYPQHLTIEDTIENLGRAFLGLSISCARCHDHKFDAISKEDYYGLYGIFQSTRYPFPGIELDKKPRDFVPLIEEEKYEALIEPYKKAVTEADAQVKELKEQKKAADKAGEKERVAQLEKEIKEATARRNQVKEPKFERAYAVADAKPVDAKIHQRGDPKSPGAEVPRRFLDVLGGQSLSDDEAKSSGRKQLAEWIVDPKNPLTARVMVNRIWHYHFGSGLVETPNDFGVRGQPPSHSALLDWLASEFVAGGWSIKKVHRAVMLSRVYQLASSDDEQNLKRDPGNQFHWRFNRRRLDAEQFRDSVMLLSGTLDTSLMKSPHPFPPTEKWEFTQHHPFNGVYPTTRRSVYMMSKRLTALPYLQTFDGADPNASTPRRDASVTTVQALYLLNNEFVQEQAAKFAERLLAERPDDRSRIDRAFNLVLGRMPTPSERERSLQFLEQARQKLQPAKADDPDSFRRGTSVWTSFAAVMFRINEFLYID